jgi:diguanylate cyclase (GGDEF)-like protein
VTAAATFCSIFFSIGLVAVLDLWVKGSIPREDVLIGAVIPAVLAPLMLFGFVRLSQQLARAESQLRTLAAEDPLTGVFNRRRFLELAGVEWARGTRHAHAQSLLVIDVDQFKTVNDEYGHLSGDQTLRHAADECRGCLRRTDLLGRWGGDEFVILLPETGVAGALRMAERIRHSIEGSEIRTPAGTVRITVSIGVAGRHLGIRSVDGMVADADAALYRAKTRGRNRVVGPEKSGAADRAPAEETTADA